MSSKKELEASQEIVLLRDAIIMARGWDFQDEGCSEKCAALLKEAVDGVEIMLAVDSDDPEAGRWARSTMHELIYYKTMMSSDDLDEASLRYCEHVCQALPAIGWQTYVRCIAACGWTDLAEEVMSRGSDRKVVVDRILCALRGLQSVPDFLDLFYAALRVRLGPTVFEAAALVPLEPDLAWLRSSCAGPVPDHCVASSARFLVHLGGNLRATAEGAVAAEGAAVESSMRHIAALLESMLRGSEAAPHVVESCAAAARALRDKLGGSLALDGLLDFIDGRSGSGGDGRLDLCVESVSKRDSMHEAALERLVASVDPAAMDCLLLNSDLLRPEHVRALLLQAEGTATAQIHRVVRRAFSGWDFAAQDRFRGEWHCQHGFTECVFADADLPQALTEAVNMLSSTGGEVNADAARDISLLCLQAPAATLAKIFDFAVRSGQADTAAQIFGLLKESFGFVDAGGVPFSLGCVVSRISAAELTAQELAGLSNLVEALVEADILDPSQLFATCILPHLVPSDLCRRFLHLLRVLLERFGVQRTLGTSPLPVVVLRLSRLLRYCTTADQVELKERLLAALDPMLRGSGTASPHEPCWLWSKLGADFAALPYLLEWFAANGLESSCLQAVDRMSQPHLLLSCVRQTDKDSVIACACRQRLRVDRIAVTTAAILPRLLVSEVVPLLGELSVLYAGSNFHLAAISITLDSLLVLSKCGGLPEPQWNHVAQTCITSIKVFLSYHHPLESQSLAVIATIVCHAAEDSTLAFRSAVGIFLQDLFGQTHSLEKDAASHVLRAVKRLGDAKLISLLERLLESKIQA